ncbi:hypothetical protein SYNPS1DRAFT_26805 [Syncephalis pseudoplumigaleata]|uniref:Chromosome segregation in meiosis protein n=1 Tax=Syncephalis pseudoplumigaleata TaxID=1712513 RepID=A0A4P9Z4N7_9FUNG|nr:hypothetical protein SYNPS1DRAFT_26805 [Syncephalis pseudoplumigaleata]|eukprot:RKP27543.1 hypothetical protein SYNPS1DRAFT_26805 [Syncephalis pseudoplumigaleata]
MEEHYEPLDSYDVPAKVADAPAEAEAASSSSMAAVAYADESTPSSAAPRRPMAKLDAERLLGDVGLPWIRVHAKRVQLSGEKGSSAKVKDLRKILRFYELWAHRLYPRYGFRTLEEADDHDGHHSDNDDNNSVHSDAAMDEHERASTRSAEPAAPLNMDADDDEDAAPVTRTRPASQKWILFDDEHDDDDTDQEEQQATAANGHNDGEDEDAAMSDASIEL